MTAHHFTTTGVGATRDAKTGVVTMNLDTTNGPVHIDLTEEFAEALGLILLDDPEHSDGYVEAESAWGGRA